MPAAAGAVVAGVYGFATGKGIFNGIRFKNEREAVKGYIALRKKPAEFSNISLSGKGFMTILTEEDGQKYILYMYRYEGAYIFNENKVDNV